MSFLRYSFESGNGVVTAFVEGITAQDPAESHPAALQGAVFFNGFQRVLRTGRGIAAAGRPKRRNSPAAILSFLLTINIFQPASDCPKIRRPVNPKARRSRQLKGPTAAPPRRPGPKPRQPANPAARQSESRPRRSGNPAILRPGDLKTGVQTSAPDNIPRQAACKITNSFRSPPFRPPFTAPSFPGPASGS